MVGDVDQNEEDLFEKTINRKEEIHFGYRFKDQHYLKCMFIY